MGDIDPISAVLVQIDTLKTQRANELATAAALTNAQAGITAAQAALADAQAAHTASTKASNDTIASIEAALESMKTPA